MATMTIRSIDEDLKARLRARAAANGHSMEAEVREILRAALRPEDAEPFGSRIHARFAALGGVDLDIPERDGGARPVELDG